MTSIDPRTPKQEAGPPMPADGTALANTLVLVKPARKTREPTFTQHLRPEPTTPEKGGAEHSPELFDTLFKRRLSGAQPTRSTTIPSIPELADRREHAAAPRSRHRAAVMG